MKMDNITLMYYKTLLKNQLTSKKRVSVNSYKNMVYVNIREYFEKNGELLPTKKGFQIYYEYFRNCT